MKITGSNKSFPIIAAVLVSSLTFALFVTHHFRASQPGHRSFSAVSPSDYDTIPVKKVSTQDSLFNALMGSADKFYREKNYEKSQAELIRAQQIRPTDYNLKDRISKLNILVATQKEQRETSRKSVASGDAYFKAKDYLNAKSAYQLAVSQDPGNDAAQEKLRQTLDLLRSQKAQNILFDVAVAGADKLFQAGEYDKAMQEYENAGKLLPGDPYPKNKINEIIKIQVNLKVKEEEYGKAIASADKFLLEKKYQDALLDYQKAAGIKPDEKYPQDKIKELTGLLATIKARDDAYHTAISLGDQALSSLLYQDAIKFYKDALAIKPDEAYPRNKIREIEGSLARITSSQADYDKYVNLADSLYIDKQYLMAKENYQLASNVKPAEAYPKEMISKADKLLATQEAANANTLKDKESQYNYAISSGDRAFTNKVYEIARAEYQNALAIKPNEVYPKSKITEIDKLVAADAQQRAADARYANSIGEADSLFIIKAWQQAKSEFQKASNMKPDEIYPKNRINEINLILADLEKQKSFETQYSGLISKGDKLFAEKSYSPAKTAYENASAMKPQEAYPKDKISEIERILTDLAASKARDAEYDAIIAGADKFFALKAYDSARNEYQAAGNTKPAERYPKDKIAEIDKILADIAAANQAAIARQKALEEDYAAAISRADKSLAEKAYEPALTGYQEALKLKPAEEYPKGKISEINEILAKLEQQKSLDAQYSGLIAKADKLFEEKTYLQARDEYTNASKLKPKETYPQERLSAIEKILSDLAAAKALDDKYAGIVANADKLLASKTYEQARDEYRNALTVKPSETYPAGKIAEIDKILSDIAAAKTLDENYKSAIELADRYLSEKKYQSAKDEYTKASGLKPLEKYPVTKIGEIDVILAAIAKQKALDEEYAALIVNADKLLAEKSYEPAKIQYQSALKIKPAEQYPKDKIGVIDAALADLAAAKALDEKYAGIIANADKLLGQKSYAPARAEYVNALNLKAQESYPKDKISEIDAALAGIAAAKALDEKYAGIIAGADKLFAAKTYEGARTEYQKAGTVKPAETYPAEKIAEIDRILGEIAAAKSLEEKYKLTIASADRHLLEKDYETSKTDYLNASELKPAEQYPKTKIAEIEAAVAAIARQKALEEEYAATVANADKLLSEKSYEPAKAGYQKGLVLKPGEQYPKTKLAEIDKALADVARLRVIDEQYGAAIAGADKLFSDKDYERAKQAYTDAGKIKPAEQYPRDKILEINDLLASIAKQKTLDDQYKASLARADQLLAAKTYDQARLEYTKAVELKPAEQYPKDKITEIDGVLAGLKAKEDAYKASLATADQLLLQKKYEDARAEYQNALVIKPGETYPTEKIALINKALEELMGKQKYYDKLITDADFSFKDKDWMKAKETYQQALGVFPAQPYPKERISLITAKVDSLYRANKSFYDKAVADGDRYFNSFEFDKAIDAYTDAMNYLPMEKYPREMIVKIRRTIAENAIADVLKSDVTITSNTEKQFPFSPVNIASRKNNFIYIKIKNLSGKPFNVLMRYGKDKQANGGVVMKNLNADGKINERLVSVRDQDLWSREDNNWISLYPQGGDVEVSFIQVSRAK